MNAATPESPRTPSDAHSLPHPLNILTSLAFSHVFLIVSCLPMRTESPAASTIDILFEHAMRHHQQRQWAEAEALYRQILEQNPAHADTLHLLGLLAGQMGHAEAGIALISQAIAIDPSASVYYNNLGALCEESGNIAKAEETYRQALKVHPEMLEAYNNLVRLLQNAQRLEEIEALNQDLHTKKGRELSLKKYQLIVNTRKSSLHMEYPAHVHMETMAKCNAACVFCPYPDLERKGAQMSDALVEKIINDLTDIPSSLGFQLSPFKVNEPFLDVRLFDILDSINQKLPNAKLTLTTNASAATEKNLAQLAKVKNLDYLWISFNDHREQEYEATMKLPYKRTIERLNLIHQKKQAGELPLRVVLSRVGDGSTEDSAFREWVKEHYPAFETSIFQRGAWIGQVKDIEQDVPDVGCTRWFEISITATGTVAHCCMDGQAKWPIGDVNTQHVLEVYNAPHYRQLREKTISRKDASPCNACAFL